MTLPHRRGLWIGSSPKAPTRRRRKFALIPVWVLPALVALTLLAGTPGGASSATHNVSRNLSAASGPKAELQRLKKQADQATADLSAATKKYEASKSKLDLAKARLKRTRSEAATADSQYTKWQHKVAGFAAAAYGSPLPNRNSVLLTAPDAQSAIEQATSLDAVTDSNEMAISKAAAQKKRADSLAANAQKLADGIAKERASLAATMKRLKQQSAKTTKRLMKLLQRLNGGRASRGGPRVLLSQSCDGSKSTLHVGSFSNGLLPSWALCPLQGYPGDKLRPEAALSFAKMNRAYQLHFGSGICITDSYRSLGEQQSVYATKPGLAAVPGTSNHGLGWALDLGCGIQDFHSAEFDWMKANSAQFGWVHPSWAESSPFEPWHWEYQPGSHAEPSAGTPDIGHGGTG